MKHKTAAAIFLLYGLLLDPALSTTQLLKTDSTLQHHLTQPAPPSRDYVKELGWITKKVNHCICEGYYQPLVTPQIAPSQPLAAQALQVSSEKSASLQANGKISFHGGVTLTQANKTLTAEQVDFFRQPEDGKIAWALMSGNVRFFDPQLLVISEQGRADFKQKRYQFFKSLYRLIRAEETTPGIWGTAQELTNDSSSTVHITQATCTTCPPNTQVWHLKCKRLKLDRTSGRGEAKHAILFVKQLPVLYMPYFNFALSSKRQSGFLTPNPSYASGSGFVLEIPYYFNLAPNYDLTLAPELIAKRGLFSKAQFRHLTASSQGQANLSYIGHDTAFQNFRNSHTDRDKIPSLKHSSPNRGALNLKHQSWLGTRWKTGLELNYVTDDYFCDDFANQPSYEDTDQLLNRAELTYDSEHWSLLSRLQLFQTLHPITHTKTYAQYKRLPQISLHGLYPNTFFNLDYEVSSEINNFVSPSTEYNESKYVVDGLRFNLNHTLSRPFTWSLGALTPKIELNTITYAISDNKNRKENSLANNHSQLFPIFSLQHSSLLGRELQLGRQSYKQTLEPTLLYLFAPYQNQDGLPVFDTCLSTFDFNQILRTNRFVGNDRVGDAHQIALALRTRFLNASGQEKFNASVGQILALKQHGVNLQDSYYAPFNPDPLQHNKLSPLVSQAQYYMGQNFQGQLDLAWSPNDRRMKNIGASIQYLGSSNNILNLWYNYAVDEDQMIQGEPVDLSRLGCSSHWRLNQNWNIFGSVAYNLSYKLTNNCMGGIEYQSCCWGVRLAYTRRFVGMGSSGGLQKTYDSGYYIQFVLHGLGNTNVGNMNNLLAGQITGFKDNFSRR